MIELPRSSETLLVRTDFSNDAAWEALRAVVSAPNEDDFMAYVGFVDDRRYSGTAPEEALGLLPDDYRHRLLILADADTLASEEFPLLVVDLREVRGRRIRVVAAKLWSIENNLSISNMDFGEFAGAVDEDGVFRGF